MLGIALSLVPCLRLDCARGYVFTTKFRIVLHDLMHQMFNHLLANEPILLARQFCNCLCDRVNDFIRFSSVDLVRPGRCRIIGKEIVDQFCDHAMKAGSFLVIFQHGIDVSMR
jgi:hypothetical protein